jgi:hypothetical protein
MVKPGDLTTMLGQWRIVVRQAEESARAGRYDDALALLTQSSVSEHRQAVQLRGRLARELLDRGRRRAEADDVIGAASDVALAERHGVPPDQVAAARLDIAERSAADVRLALEVGDPARALERVEWLAGQAICGPTLRRYRELAEAWKRGLDDSRRGEFGPAREALDRAGRLAGELAREALEAARRECDTRQAGSSGRVERLYKALAAESPDWGAILLAAETVLEIVPEHPAARQARARAWQQIGSLNPGAALPGRIGRREPAEPAHLTNPDGWIRHHGELAAGPIRGESIRFLEPGESSQTASPSGSRAAPAAAGASSPHGRFLLWADAIGGYLVCLDSEVVLGRAGPDSHADVPLLGDLSRRHATLVRQGDGYIVRAHHATFINGRSIAGQSPLRDNDVVRLGNSVELLFRQPSPVSATARLEILSRHRMPLAVEGAILMAETCILGPGPQSHVLAPRLKAPIILFRQGGRLWCRAGGAFDVDGQPRQGRSALEMTARVHGDGFSFSLEPLGPTASVS